MAFERWQGGRKTNDYRFFDRIIKENFRIGGVGIYIHKYLGVFDQTTPPDGTPIVETLPGQTNTVSSGDNVTTIQDVLLLENRDRKYDPDVYVLKGVYNVNDVEFDLRQFGLFLSNDDLYISFHYNDMIEKLGRKIIPGDVFELLHLRDVDLINDGPPINKFYEVTDCNRSAEGFSPTWFHHIWRVKCKPLTDSQEFNDILDKPSTVMPLDLVNIPNTTDQALKDLISTFNSDIKISDEITAAADFEVGFTYFETGQFYVAPNQERNSQYPWILSGDGVPPNGSILVGSGSVFPQNPKQDDWYLRTDYAPPVLFKYDNSKWRRQEIAWRIPKESANGILASFINNKKQVDIPGYGKVPQKVALSKAVLPRADLKPPGPKSGT